MKRRRRRRRIREGREEDFIRGGGEREGQLPRRPPRTDVGAKCRVAK